MRITLEADHMIAAMCLLCRSGTSWAGSCMKLHILQRSLVLLGQLAGSCLRRTADEFSMPTLVASATESEGAVFTDRKKISTSNEFLGLSRLLVVRIILRVLLKPIWLSVFLRSSSTLAPFSRAIDSIFVRF